MNKAEMALTAEVVDALIRIKIYNCLVDEVKTIGIAKTLEEEKMKQLDVSSFEMPDANTFLMKAYLDDFEDETLIDIWKLTTDYVAMIPEDIKVFHTESEFDFRMLQEANMGEAAPFASLLENAIRESGIRKEFFVEMYDLSSELHIKFASEKEARTFAEMVSPSTVYQLDEDGVSWIDLDSY